MIFDIKRDGGRLIVSGDRQAVTILLAEARSSLSSTMMAMRNPSKMKDGYGRAYQGLLDALAASPDVALGPIVSVYGIVAPATEAFSKVEAADDLDDLLS